MAFDFMAHINNVQEASRAETCPACDEPSACAPEEVFCVENATTGKCAVPTITATVQLPASERIAINDANGLGYGTRVTEGS